MVLKDELETFVDGVFSNSWEPRNGQKVPTPEEVGHGNKAVKLDAVVLYADLAGSTKLVETRHDWVAASVYKSYLYCAAKIVRANGGEITAYDGDRVMAVFIGDAKNSNAAKMAALSPKYPTYVTADVYRLLNEKSKLGGNPKRDMWTSLGTTDFGVDIYGSTFWCSF